MQLRGFRKFTAYMSALTCSTALQAAGMLDASAYATIVTTGLGLFAAGNVGEHFSKRGKE